MFEPVIFGGLVLAADQACACSCGCNNGAGCGSGQGAGGEPVVVGNACSQ